MDEGNTKGVDLLLGDPKKAVLIMAIPLLISLVAQSMNNIIDTVWVSGLGSSEVAATGFVLPLFLILVGVGNGIGVGASSAISKHIGAGDRNSADRVAFQALMITLVASIAITLFLLLLERPIISAIGAGDATDVSIAYGRPIFIGAIVLLFNGVLANLLRSEGDSKRAMITQLIGVGINIILDPIFIYPAGHFEWLPFGLDMGLPGAAWATVIAFVIPTLIQLYWFFVKRDTYLNVVDHKIRFHPDDDKEILKVGIPSSMEMFVLSISIVLLNMIIGNNGHFIDNVTINTCVWKVIDILMMPLLAISFGIIPVLGAAYGAKRNDNIRIAFMYALKLCVGLAIAMSALTIIFSDGMVFLFTYGEDTSRLRPEMASILAITCTILPFVATGIMASGFFQSLGLGVKSLMTCVIRNALQLPVCYVISLTTLSLGTLVWGIWFGEVVGSLIAFFWGYYVLRKLLKGEIQYIRGMPKQ